MGYPGEVYTSIDFMAALGAVTLNWAAIETALDFATATIFHEFRNDKMEPEVPRNLERKLKFIRQALIHQKLAPIRDAADALVTDLLANKDDRHGLVHGSVMGVEDDGDTVHVLRIRYAPKRHILSDTRVTTAEVEACAHRAHELSYRATALSIAVWNAAKPHDPIDYPLGEFAG